MIDRPSFWIATLLLGVGTYAIRLSFLAWSQSRPFSDRVKKLLDFTPVTVLPALITPAIVYPAATDGTFDPARIIAAIVALAVGVWTKSVIAVLVAGIGSLMLANLVIMRL